MISSTTVEKNVATLQQLSDAAVTALVQGPTTDAQTRQDALRLCESVSQSENGWDLCMELFILNAPLEARFWALLVVTDRIYELPSPHRARVRERFLQYLSRDLPEKIAREMGRSSQAGESAAGSGFFEPLPIRNKMAVLFNRLLILDFPEAWSDPFSELLGLINTFWEISSAITAEETTASAPCRASVARSVLSELLDFYFRVLKFFDEDVVSDSVEKAAADILRRSKVKDSLKECEVPKLVASWRSVLASALDSCDARDASTKPGLYSHDWQRLKSPFTWEMLGRCLEVMGRFVDWIDVSLVANEVLLSLVLRFVGWRTSREPDKVPWAPCAPEAIKCLCGIVRKHMPPQQKYSLLKLLDFVPSTFEMFCTLKMVAADPNRSGASKSSAFNEKLAELVNAIGVELLDMADELKRLVPVGPPHAASNGGAPLFYPPLSPETELLTKQIWDLVFEILGTAVELFSEHEYQVSLAIEPFLSTLSKHLKCVVVDDCVGELTSRQTQGSDSAGLSSTPTGVKIPLSRIVPLIRTLMHTIMQKCRYPSNISFDPQASLAAAADPSRPQLISDETEHLTDEPHIKFLEFRNAITLLFKRTIGISERVTTDFLLEVVESLCAFVEAEERKQTHADATAIEAALHTFYSSGEILKDPQRLLSDPKHPLSVCVTRLLNCKPLLEHPHSEVRVIIFDVIMRFNSIFFNDTPLLVRILRYLLGAAGVVSSSTDAKISSHATSALLRIIKAHAPQIKPLASEAAAVVAQVCASALLSLSVNTCPVGDQSLREAVHATFAASPSGDLHKAACVSKDDLQRLFEVAGQLLGEKSGGKSPQTFASFAIEDRKEHLHRFLEILVVPMIRVSIAIREAPASRAAVLLDILALLLQCLASLPKGLHDAAGSFAREWNMTFVVALATVAHLPPQAALAVRGPLLLLCRSMLHPAWAQNLEALRFALPMVLASIAGDAGVVEVPQVAHILSRCIVTFKAEASSSLLLARPLHFPSEILREVLAPLPRRGPALPEVFRRLDAAVHGAGVDEFTLLIEGALPPPCVYLFFETHWKLWKSMPEESCELRRQKTEVQASLCHVFQTMAAHDVAALASLFFSPAGGPYGHGGAAANFPEHRRRLMEFMLDSCTADAPHAVALPTLQIFSKVLAAALNTECVADALVEEFVRWSESFLKVVCVAVVSLDLDDANSLKNLLECCSIFHAIIRPASPSLSSIAACREALLSQLSRSLVASFAECPKSQKVPEEGRVAAAAQTTEKVFETIMRLDGCSIKEIRASVLQILKTRTKTEFCGA